MILLLLPAVGGIVKYGSLAASSESRNVNIAMSGYAALGPATNAARLLRHLDLHLLEQPLTCSTAWLASPAPRPDDPSRPDGVEGAGNSVEEGE